jgi:leishmanolysin-like peptidase
MEDNGGIGTSESHWERRLFFNELMTGTDTPGDFIFSIFTFMLLQDSGWYRL